MKSIWWNQVTNAVKYVTEIKQSLLEERSILLKYSKAMPWREQFEESVREAVKLQNAEKKFVDIPEVNEPGEYLLKEFCKKEKRAEYRPSKGYAKFFAESDDIVLHDRYLWIQVGDAKSLDKWMSFVSAYIQERGKHDKKAVFVLEWADEAPISTKKGIKAFSFDDYIGEYDRVVFAVLASSDIHENLFIKNYVAELVSTGAGNDIELCAECIRSYKTFLDNPLIFIENGLSDKRRSDGMKYIVNQNASMIEHLIWRAQIKTVYPHLEEFREEFVRKHANLISNQLPIQASYGEIYTDPKDVELGTLMYMAGNGLLQLNNTEYEKLKKFKEARNKLAHLNSLSLGEIKELI